MRRLQVFVSSTYVDLKEERQAAVSAILKAGHIPAGMELFAAGDRSQLEVIRKWIDDSDVYMLILGGRYGSIEKDSGLSYTELEYDYAVAKGKPLFAVVIDEKALEQKITTSGLDVDERSAPEKLRNFRAKVLSKMCSLYVDLKDIRGAVFESLLDITHRYSLAGWVRADDHASLSDLRSKLENITSERDRLAIELGELKSAETTELPTPSKSNQFDALQEVLKDIKSTLPAEMSSNGVEGERNVLQLLEANKYLLVRGWLVAKAPDDKIKWFERNLLTHLVIHDLVTVDRTPVGARYTLNSRGTDLLAWRDKIRHSANRKKAAASKEPTGQS